MPRLSDSMVDGTITTWLRADGDEITIGEEIVEIETDKAVMPYQAEYAGTLRIVAQDGAVICVGDVIGYIGAAEDSDAAAAPAQATAAAAQAGGIDSPAAPLRPRRPAQRPRRRRRASELRELDPHPSTHQRPHQGLAGCQAPGGLARGRPDDARGLRARRADRQA